MAILRGYKERRGTIVTGLAVWWCNANPEIINLCCIIIVIVISPIETKVEKKKPTKIVIIHFFQSFWGYIKLYTIDGGSTNSDVFR